MTFEEYIKNAIETLERSGKGISNREMVKITPEIQKKLDELKNAIESNKDEDQSFAEANALAYVKTQYGMDQEDNDEERLDAEEGDNQPEESVVEDKPSLRMLENSELYDDEIADNLDLANKEGDNEIRQNQEEVREKSAGFFTKMTAWITGFSFFKKSQKNKKREITKVRKSEENAKEGEGKPIELKPNEVNPEEIDLKNLNLDDLGQEDELNVGGIADQAGGEQPEAAIDEENKKIADLADSKSEDELLTMIKNNDLELDQRDLAMKALTSQMEKMEPQNLLKIIDGIKEDPDRKSAAVDAILPKLGKEDLLAMAERYSLSADQNGALVSAFIRRNPTLRELRQMIRRADAFPAEAVRTLRENFNNGLNTAGLYEIKAIVDERPMGDSYLADPTYYDAKKQYNAQKPYAITRFMNKKILRRRNQEEEDYNWNKKYGINAPDSDFLKEKKLSNPKTEEEEERVLVLWAEKNKYDLKKIRANKAAYKKKNGEGWLEEDDDSYFNAQYREMQAKLKEKTASEQRIRSLEEKIRQLEAAQSKLTAANASGSKEEEITDSKPEINPVEMKAEFNQTQSKAEEINPPENSKQNAENAVINQGFEMNNQSNVISTGIGIEENKLNAINNKKIEEANNIADKENEIKEENK